MNLVRTSGWAWLERLAVSLTIFFCSGVMILFMKVKKGGVVLEGESNMIRHLICFSLYAVILFLLALRWKAAWRVMQRDGLLWVLVLVTLGSMVWSDAPSVTLHRNLSFLGTTGLGVYLATRYSLSEQVRLLAGTLTVAGVASLVLTLLFPDYGSHGEEWQDAWRGIYVHKNVLGREMALCSLAMMTLILTGPRRWLACAGFALSFILVVLSLSKWSLVVVVGMGGVLAVCRAYQKNRMLAGVLLLTAGLAAVLVVPWMINNFDIVTGVVGKDASLSGRTTIWDVVLEKIERRPWLGYGFYAFWRGWDGESAHVWQAFGSVVPNGHNGYLDIWLDLGILGVAVFALGFILAFFRALAELRRAGSVGRLWPVGFLTFLFIYSWNESSLLKEHNLFWAYYVATVLSRPLSLRAPSSRSLSAQAPGESGSTPVGFVHG